MRLSFTPLDYEQIISCPYLHKAIIDKTIKMINCGNLSFGGARACLKNACAGLGVPLCGRKGAILGA